MKTTKTNEFNICLRMDETVSQLVNTAPNTYWYNYNNEVIIKHKEDFIEIDNNGFIKMLNVNEFNDVEFKHIISYAKNLNNMDFL